MTAHRMVNDVHNNLDAGRRSIVTIFRASSRALWDVRASTVPHSLIIFSSCSGIPSLRVTLRVSINSGASLRMRE